MHFLLKRGPRKDQALTLDFWFPCVRPRTVSAHLGRGRVALLADPGVSRLFGGLLQWRVQAAKVIAETTLITPEGQTDGQTTICCQSSHKESFYTLFQGQPVADDG